MMLIKTSASLSDINETTFVKINGKEKTSLGPYCFAHEKQLNFASLN